jgi:hypothetical protein
LEQTPYPARFRAAFDPSPKSPDPICPRKPQSRGSQAKGNAVDVDEKGALQTAVGGWLYLAVVLDLFTRNIVGWRCVITCGRN